MDISIQALALIKSRDKMEEDKNKLKEIQEELKKLKEILYTPDDFSSRMNQENFNNSEAESRSVIIGNVDYGTTSENLESHFSACGSITRVTIQYDKYTGSPKGFAFIEFSEKNSVKIAVGLDQSSFRGRKIKVVPKKTSRPGISAANSAPRGRFPPATKYAYYRERRSVIRSKSGSNSGTYRPSPYAWKK